jgi:uncharacterized protein (TIGR03437 family)
MKCICCFITFAVCAAAQITFPSLNKSPWLGQELLTRVAATSVNVNVAFDRDMQVYAEYGTAPGAYTSKTSTQTASANVPLNFSLTNLKPNTRYYYRVQYAPAGSAAFTDRPEHSFATQPPRGTPFTFLIQADPHMDNNSSTSVYQLTMANELAEKADFLIDLGDTMLTDKLDSKGVPGGGNGQPTAAGVLDRTQMHRSYYDLATHSLPLFVALGNHEGEWGSKLNGTPNNFALWDDVFRTNYFSPPAPDEFFSGDTQSYDGNGAPCVPGTLVTCGLGQRRSYYSWEWGDALFVVLDPFWNQTTANSPNQAGSGQDCCRSGDWSLTLGTAQYNWLKQTLEKSTAPYKFVFAHNLVGGINPMANGQAQGPMRGGVEVAKYLEWGGYNLDGSYGFNTYRPNMAMPIHQLLLTNHVTAFFHGHDHLYAYQTLDGIAYQEVPQPSASNGNLGNRASDYGYVQGTLLGGRGYLRVQVSPSGAKVQYIETWLPSEEKGAQKNGMVADTYTLMPYSASALPAISRVANAAGAISTIAPNSWVEIDGSNLAPATSTRSWKANDFVNNQMPTQLDGVSVSVNGKAAYVSYVSPKQINILTPPDAMTGPVTVRVAVNGSASASFTAQAQAVAPAFFTLGTSPYVAGMHADYSYLGPSTLYPGYTAPAKPGETILVYANGFGATTKSITAGSPNQSGTLARMPDVQIGGVPATVQFAGLVSPGLYQLNVVVPANVPDGDQFITATYSGATTQTGALVAVHR